MWACTNDTDCQDNLFANSRNGVVSGDCNTTTNVCRIFGWGPVELKAEDKLSGLPGYKNQLLAAVNFTVFVKNNIFFPIFGAKVLCSLA